MGRSVIKSNSKDKADPRFLSNLWPALPILVIIVVLLAWALIQNGQNRVFIHPSPITSNADLSSTPETFFTLLTPEDLDRGMYFLASDQTRSFPPELHCTMNDFLKTEKEYFHLRGKSRLLRTSLSKITLSVVEELPEEALVELGENSNNNQRLKRGH